MPTRILITGSRDWPCYDLADAVLTRLMLKFGPDLTIVHGDCPTGVDKAFDEAANELGLEVHPFPADWTAHGKGAGPRRNQAMVDAGADLCVALSRDLKASRGTLDCARRAIAAKIPTCLVDDEGGEPRWISEV